MSNYNIKTNRTFTAIRKYGWLLTVIVAIGGSFWVPKLGLIVALVMLSLIVSGFFNGRFWCGNVCPHGSLFDRVIMPISLNKKIPKFFKSKTFIIIFFTYFMTNFSTKILKIFGIWDKYAFFAKLNFLDKIDLWGKVMGPPNPAIVTGTLDKVGLLFSRTYLMVLVVGGILSILVDSRVWCQFCPMGSLQKLSHRLGRALNVASKTEKKITISSKEQCHACGKCSRVCPFQLTPYLEFSDNNQFDNVNCIKCSTCVENCPAGILSLETAVDAVKLKELTPITGYENRQEIISVITEINDLADEVKEYVFSFQSPKKVDYQSGQFILIKIEDEPLAYRAYSISSYNEDSTGLSVIIKRVDKGYGTDIIFNTFKVGDTITLEGPMGNDLVLDKSAEKVLFIGNGIGITPFIALSKDVLLNYPSAKEVTLLDGQRYEKEFLYSDYFKSLAEEYDHFKYVPMVSREDVDSIRRGYVTAVLKEMDLEGYTVYMCGSTNMITDSYNILLSKGVKKENIYYESEDKITMEEAV